MSNTGFDKSRLFSAQENVLQGNANDIVSRYSNLGSSNPLKGPTARSLFYEAGKRTPGKYGQYLFYSFGSNENNFIDAYYRSESAGYNTRVSSIESKNPSAGFLVRQTANLEASADQNDGILKGLRSSFENSILGGLSAPYYWKDFLYCKYYGSIPNNYMITLRRFPTPVLDNMSIPQAIKDSEEYSARGAGRPVAQAVTWFGGNTGNSLNTIIGFGTGINWGTKSQSETKTQQAFSKGLFMDGPLGLLGNKLKSLSTKGSTIFDLLQKISNGALAATDPNETSTRAIRAYNLRDRAKNPEDGGLMSEYIWVPVDSVMNTRYRTVGLSFDWKNIIINFHYDLTSVGEVNSKAALLDILGNLLSIGTNYGNFLTPDIRYNANFGEVGFPGGNEGLQLYYSDPVEWIRIYGEEIMNLLSGIGNAAETSEGVSEDSQSKYQRLKLELETIGKNGGNVTQKIGTMRQELGSDFSRLMRFAVTNSFLESYQSPVSFLTGAPIGEWHLTVGNPCNPIAMIGNLVCTGVKIEFSEALGPDDFPTGIKATFTLEHGRDRERGEIESIFNRGDGRLYQSTLKTSSDQQSFGYVANTEGNIINENTPNQLLQNGEYNSQFDGMPDNLGPF